MSRIHNREYRLESKKHRVSKQAYTITGGTHQHTIPVILKLLMWVHVFKVRLFLVLLYTRFFLPKIKFSILLSITFPPPQSRTQPPPQDFYFR